MELEERVLPMNTRRLHCCPKSLETGATMDSTPMADTQYDPHPAVEVAWLVSGNEGWSKKLAIMQGPMIAKDYLEIPDSIPSAERFLTDSAGGTYGKTAKCMGRLSASCG